MLLWLRWWEVVAQLRPAFTRKRTFLWFALCLAGISIRPDLRGVTSIVRALGLKECFYDRLLDFFHSDAVITERTRALITGIHTAPNIVVIATDTLQPPGTVRVQLPVVIDSGLGYLYIPGTTFHVFLNDTSGYALLDSVPAGVIPSISYSSKDRETPVVIRENVTILPGDTVTIAFKDWAYSRRLLLNTSVSGANVQGNVYGFPVLVRLSADVFDFTEAKTRGEDIRFTSSGDIPLPYEIEQWDAADRSAEVWVRVDTVRGNDSTQSIMMYWGNPVATDSSSSAAVFDRAKGFQGVWHLGDAVDELVCDVTVNRYHGSSPPIPPARQSPKE